MIKKYGWLVILHLGLDCTPYQWYFFFFSRSSVLLQLLNLTKVDSQESPVVLENCLGSPS